MHITLNETKGFLRLILTDLDMCCSWVGPSDDQEDGKDEAAVRPQEAPELSWHPGVLQSQPGEQSLRSD